MKFLKTLSLVSVLCFVSLTAVAEQLTIACGAVGDERKYCMESVERWSALTGHTVRVINTPNSSSDRLAMYQLLLRERHDTVDVFQIDVVWPGLLQRYLLDLSKYIPKADIAAHFPALIGNNTVNGKLVAMPWYVDTGLLFYRQDLLTKYGLSVPSTWDELESSARTVLEGERAAQPELQGLVFQSDDYEGLTCNFVEWLGSAGQTELVDSNQKMTLNSADNVAVLEQIKGMINGGLTPREILSYREEDARLMFQEGNAVFMRNWPYVWKLSQLDPSSPVAGKVGVTVLPGRTADQAGRGTLGGWQLAVTKYTRHPELAADLVNFMTSEAEQRTRLPLGYFPTRNAVYQQVPSAEIAPLFDAVGETLENALARPATALGKYYKDASRVMYNEVNDFLADPDESAQALLTELAREVARVSQNKVTAE